MKKPVPQKRIRFFIVLLKISFFYAVRSSVAELFSSGNFFNYNSCVSSNRINGSNFFYYTFCFFNNCFFCGCFSISSVVSLACASDHRKACDNSERQE